MLPELLDPPLDGPSPDPPDELLPEASFDELPLEPLDVPPDELPLELLESVDASEEPPLEPSSEDDGSPESALVDASPGPVGLELHAITPSTKKGAVERIGRPLFGAALAGA